MNYFEKANSLYHCSKFEKAIDLYYKELKLDPNNTSALYNAAVCYIKLKKYNEAISLLENVLKIKVTSSYLFNLAYCYAMLNDHKKALIYFNTSWALDNTDSECKTAIDIILKHYSKIRKK